MYETFHEDEKVASATDCTGLMLTMPEDETEDINEASLYAIHCAPEDQYAQEESQSGADQHYRCRPCGNRTVVGRNDAADEQS